PQDELQARKRVPCVGQEGLRAVVVHHCTNRCIEGLEWFARPSARTRVRKCVFCRPGVVLVGLLLFFLAYARDLTKTLPTHLFEHHLLAQLEPRLFAFMNVFRENAASWKPLPVKSASACRWPKPFCACLPILRSPSSSTGCTTDTAAVAMRRSSA